MECEVTGLGFLTTRGFLVDNRWRADADVLDLAYAYIGLGEFKRTLLSCESVRGKRGSKLQFHGFGWEIDCWGLSEKCVDNENWNFYYTGTVLEENQRVLFAHLPMWGKWETRWGKLETKWDFHVEIGTLNLLWGIQLLFDVLASLQWVYCNKMATPQGVDFASLLELSSRWPRHLVDYLFCSADSPRIRVISSPFDELVWGVYVVPTVPLPTQKYFVNFSVL